MSKLILSYFFKTNLTAFRSAIIHNDTNKICRILDLDRENLHKELDNTGNTALTLAVKYASPLTVRSLLQQGAHPDLPNPLTYQTPLGLLASKIYENGQSSEAKRAVEIGTILLDHGAYVDKPSPYLYKDEFGKDYVNKETPLMTAVRTKNLSLVTLFIERKANVNYTEKHSQNRPIHFAVTNGDLAMFELLEKAGALYRTILTNEQYTLLHWFCYNKANDEHMPLLKKLIKKGCDINAENNLQRTALMLAVKSDMINTCHALLDAQARIDIIDCKGNQAIDFAKPNSECFKLIQQAKNIEQIKLQSRYISHTKSDDGVLWRKPINSIHVITKQFSDPTNNLKNGEIRSKCYSSSTTTDEIIIENPNDSFRIDTYQTEEIQEVDTKYKNMWDKLFQSKQKRQRARDSSQQRTRDPSQQRARDSSQQRPMESSQQRTRDSSQQRTRDPSQQRPIDSSQQRTRDSSQQRTRDPSQQRPMESSQQRTRDSSQQRTRDPSQQRPIDSSQQRTRDPSQQRPIDSSQQRTRDLSRQRTRDSSQQRTNYIH